MSERRLEKEGKEGRGTVIVASVAVGLGVVDGRGGEHHLTKVTVLIASGYEKEIKMETQ